MNHLMKRKDFLYTLSLLLLSPKLLSQDEEEENEPNDKTVIVVGAGISGLSAAHKLKENGFKVTVLEGQNRIGGRTVSNKSLGFPFDEGASWIHGTDGNPLVDLAKKSGMKTFHTKDEDRIYFDIGGKKYTEKEIEKAEEQLNKLIKNLMKKGSSKESFESVFVKKYPQFSKNRLFDFLLSTNITFDTGDLNLLSSTLYDEGEKYEGKELIITNGYDSLAKYFSNNLDIQLNQKVTKIDYSNNKIKVSHNQKISIADYVLITVPLGVLKKETIQFIPDLPKTKKKAIQNVGMGCVNKYALQWEKKFWDDVQYIGYSSDTKDKYNYFLNLKKFHPNQNALMTFSFAEAARKSELQTDTEVLQEILSNLKDIYGSSIPNPKNFLRTKWNTNQFSFGSYSYTSINTNMEDFSTLAEELNNKVYFAGEHTDVDYFSTVHGAYFSGIREADKIIEMI
jgi:monoamine oxidase